MYCKNFGVDGNQEARRQTKLKNGPKRKLHELHPPFVNSGVLLWEKQAQATSNTGSHLPQQKVHELTFLWLWRTLVNRGRQIHIREILLDNHQSSSKGTVPISTEIRWPSRCGWPGECARRRTTVKMVKTNKTVQVVKTVTTVRTVKAVQTAKV